MSVSAREGIRKYSSLLGGGHFLTLIYKHRAIITKVIGFTDNTGQAFLCYLHFLNRIGKCIKR